MGGPHVTLLPEEASQYADVLFIAKPKVSGKNSCTALKAVLSECLPTSERAIRLKHPHGTQRPVSQRDRTNGILFATADVRANVILPPLRHVSTNCASDYR